MKRVLLPLIVAVSVAVILIPVHIMPAKPLLLGERLIAGGGWLQIFLAVVYSFLLMTKMLPLENRTKWRNRSWIFFTIVFYGQLILGLFADSLFLMTGKLHLPIPAVIIAGPVYRFSSWFMPMLFLSSILLSGPAWCSHLCYFGAVDSIAAHKRNSPKKKSRFRELMWQRKPLFRIYVFIGVVLIALLLRLLNGSPGIATLFAILFFALGLLIIFTVSRRRGVMAHCTIWCPVGTLVNYLKYISPFRFVVNRGNCTSCMRCIPACNYVAMSRDEKGVLVIGNGCTYCGDCLTACPHDALEYQFTWLRGERAEKLWLVVTIVLHTLFLTLARV